MTLSTPNYGPESRELFIRWNTALPKAEERQTEASNEDQLMALAYNVDDREVKGRQFGAPRFVGMQRIELGAKGPASYHVYAAFVSADRKHQSDSLYLGEVIME